MCWDTVQANQIEEQFLRFMKLWYYFDFNKIQPMTKKKKERNIKVYN